MIRMEPYVWDHKHMQNIYAAIMSHSLENCQKPYPPHSKLDESGPNDTTKFQSLIGACQWMILLCHVDVAHAVMSLSHSHYCPCIGHIKQLKCLCGYIHKFPHGAIWFCIAIPDHEMLFIESPMKHDWVESVYGSPVKEIPEDSPKPRGHQV